MNRSNHTRTARLTTLALLAALVVVLQTVASGIKVGPVPITLTLVPIVIGAILMGPKAGALLGGVFGAVTLIAGIIGADAFTFMGAAVLAAMNIADKYYKAQDATDGLRAQVKDYAEECSKLRAEIARLRRG